MKNLQSQTQSEIFAKDCRHYSFTHHIREVNPIALRNCFRIPDKGIDVSYVNSDNIYTHFPILNSECHFDESEMGPYLGKYCTNNGITVFVDWEGRTYVAKGMWIFHALNCAGFIKADLEVPLSNGERIIDPVIRTYWEGVPDKI